jgi:1,2-diacylglycerol 3-alpha-glucosyltransferase
MNILILNPILYSGNGNYIPKVKSLKDTMIYSMCLGFKSLGHNITLIAAEDYRPTEHEEYEFKIIYFKTSLTSILPATLPYLNGLHHYLKENKDDFDMIISSEIFAIHSLSAAIIAPQKTIIWHELTKHQRKFHRIPSKLWHNIIVPHFFNRVRVVVGRSIYAIAFLKRYLHNVSTETVDHGIDIDIFNANTNKKKQFISVAQLIYRKNIDGIISKFAAFLKESPHKDFKLLIAGRGPMENELRQQVNNLNIEDYVEFLGFLSHKDLSKYVSESSAFLVNTRQDLNMVSIPESIVSGTPILTNLIPASSEYIKKNGLGITKKEWGVKEMIDIVDDNAIYVSNCINYRDKLTSKYSAQKLINIFNHYR